MKKIPPFFDRHIHFLIEGSKPKAHEIDDRIIAPMLKRGILSFYDMGGKGEHGLVIKSYCRHMKTAGAALYKKGGYGSFLGIGIDNKADISRAILNNAGKGVDFIKVINSGIVSADPSQAVSSGGFSREEMRMIVEEAAERGLRVFCHCNGEQSILDALVSGVSSIEHGFFITEECLQIMASQDTSWTPTIFALKAFRDTISDIEARRYLDSVIDKHLESVYRAHRLGIKIGAGSDSGAKGVRHGESFFEELKLLLKAGLSKEEVLRAGTMEEQELERGNYVVIDEGFFEGNSNMEVCFSSII